MAPPTEPEPFHRRDAIDATVKGTLIVGGAGLIMSAVQNTLTKQNVGPWGVVTRTGSTITTFAAMGGSYMFVRNAAANLREKDDTWNTVLGGLVSGAIMGTRYRTMPAVVGYGAALAVLLGVFDYTGGSLSGFYKNITIDEVTRKEMIRTNRRRPLEETIEEIGEGRGIYGPGYEERRRQRLSEKYGIDFSKVDS
ncbi:hypothetical protein RUND412_007470 [Rhizina undulata]